MKIRTVMRNVGCDLLVVFENEIIIFEETLLLPGGWAGCGGGRAVGA
jgi:hypothetical protein